VIAGTFVGIARKDVDILLRSQKDKLSFQCRPGHHRIFPWMISISQFGFREESALAQSRVG
jgi:hypothetical protein